MPEVKSTTTYPVIQVGDRFGKWTVLGEPFSKRMPYGKPHRYCRCHCECGTEREIPVSNLNRGLSLSCGCAGSRTTLAVRTRTHGETKTKLYGVWCAVIRRCEYAKDEHFHRYGGRGIRICEEWKASYESFRDWAMSHGYQPGMSIDRRDNDGNYCPENCHWIPIGKQAQNRSTSVVIEAFGERKVLAEWARDPRAAVRPDSISMRLKAGWAPEIAITAPAGSGRAGRLPPRDRTG